MTYFYIDFENDSREPKPCTCCHPEAEFGSFLKQNCGENDYMNL